MAESLHDIMRDRSLRRFTSAELVNELAERGVLRQYGVSQYLPGIVRARADTPKTDIDRVVRGKALHALAQYMAVNRLVAFESSPSDDPDAPPTDTKLVASILTVDPDADLDKKGE